MGWDLYTRLSAMMFMEYAVWGAWMPVLAARLLGPLKMSGKQTGYKGLDRTELLQLQLIEANTWSCDILDISSSTKKPINQVAVLLRRR